MQYLKYPDLKAIRASSHFLKENVAKVFEPKSFIEFNEHVLSAAFKNRKSIRKAFVQTAVFTFISFENDIMNKIMRIFRTNHIKYLKFNYCTFSIEELCIFINLFSQLKELDISTFRLMDKISFEQLISIVGPKVEKLTLVKVSKIIAPLTYKIQYHDECTIKYLKLQIESLQIGNRKMSRAFQYMRSSLEEFSLRINDITISTIYWFVNMKLHKLKRMQLIITSGFASDLMLEFLRMLIGQKMIQIPITHSEPKDMMCTQLRSITISCKNSDTIENFLIMIYGYVPIRVDASTYFDFTELEFLEVSIKITY